MCSTVTTTLPTRASASRVHADGSSTEQKQGEYRCVFVCVHAQRGGERLVSDWRERVPQTSSQHQRQLTARAKNYHPTFYPRVGKFFFLLSLTLAILQFSRCTGDFLFAPEQDVIKRQASTTGGAPPSGAPTIGTVCVCVGGCVVEGVSACSLGPAEKKPGSFSTPHVDEEIFNKCS